MRNVPHDDREREFTQEGADVNWFDEGKDTLGRRVAQLRTGIHEGGRAALADLPQGLERADPCARRPQGRLPRKSPSGVGFSSTAIGWRRNLSPC